MQKEEEGPLRSSFRSKLLQEKTIQEERDILTTEKLEAQTVLMKSWGNI